MTREPFTEIVSFNLSDSALKDFATVAFNFFTAMDSDTKEVRY